jgi:hypothetical protein
LQLIEIIQLTLLIFITLGVIIFLFSYLGYRTKTKAKDISKITIDERKLEDAKLDEVVELVKDSESVKQQVSVIQNPRFEVFTPASDDEVKIGSEKSHKKKSHSPKTLIIKQKP